MSLLSRLASDVAVLKAAVGRHARVPEMRWGVMASATTVTLDGDPNAVTVTRSLWTLTAGDVVQVQVQGRDRWVVGVSRASATPVMAGTWQAYGTGYASPKAYRSGGWIQLEGAVSNPTAVSTYPSLICTLPVGFRPVTGSLPRFIVVSYNTTATILGTGDIYVNPSNGGVYLARSTGTNGGAYLTILDQIRFRAA